MVDQEKIQQAVRLLLEGMGEDVEREGLLETPQRVGRMYAEICRGMDESASEHLSTTFSIDSDDMVVERDIQFYSLCEHHLLPFTGTVHLAYVTGEHIVGLGRLYDLVETVSTRLTLQERMGDELVDALMAGLDARGAIAVIEARHGCVGLRGSRQERGDVVTVSARGTLAEPAGRADVMTLLPQT